ncbi:MAG: hypothetical protein COB39_00070 [Marinosulfonomonas sp.]|nr:hypothetical protein [Marinosulfonomonas sp.]PHR00031.1 MAG: hypothetical protein COB39_00070 [Marinosulfonomonas sp.]
MTLIADILLVAGALGAAFYCMILSRRLNRFNDLEKGVGGAVAVLSVQVDDMTKTLERARGAASDSTSSLESLTGKAEDVAKRLELLMASMHDLPEPTENREEPKKDINPEAQFLRHQDRMVEAAE